MEDKAKVRSRSVYLSGYDSDYLKERFGTLRCGIETLLRQNQNAEIVKKAVESQIRRRLTIPEIHTVFERLKGVKLDGAIRLQNALLVQTIADSLALYPSDKVEVSVLLSKLEQLTPAETAVIYQLAEESWEKSK